MNIGPNPTISIVTPCLNRASLIGEAVESVLDQDYPQVEHIIMDGGSTDGTLEVLAKYPNLRVVSELDKGIYDAVNKGIQIATGDVIGLLNSDDFYAPNIFTSVVRLLIDDPECDALVGSAIFFRGNSTTEYKEVIRFPAITSDQLLLRSTSGTPIINAWFFRKRVFSDIGLFNIQYSYSADREFLIRYALRSKRIITLDKPLYHYRVHADSATLSMNDSGEAPYVLEDRSIAETFLSMRDIDPQVKKVFRNWHSQSTSHQCAAALRRGAVRDCMDYFYRGMRFNILLPAIFIQREISRAVRLLNKNVRGSHS
jgi:glycosyltransferase involved in cell wall biosynthesis